MYKLFIHTRYLNLLLRSIFANEIQRSRFFISKPSSFRSLLSARFQRQRDARRPCNAYSNLTRSVWGASLICRNKRRLPRLEWAQDLGNKTELRSLSLHDDWHLGSKSHKSICIRSLCTCDAYDDADVLVDTIWYNLANISLRNEAINFIDKLIQTD